MAIRIAPKSGIEWLTSDGRLTRGKYKGELVEDIAYSDPGYLSWVLREVLDMSDEDRQIMEIHLERAT